MWKSTRNLMPAAALCLMTLSLSRLWRFRYLQDEVSLVSTTTTASPPKSCVHDGNLGHDLFHNRDEQSSTRATCDRFDTLYARWVVSTLRFEECMDRLHEAQQTWSNANTTTTCSSDCSEVVHATWKGSLPETARLGLLSILYAYRDHDCFTLLLWVTDDETEASLRRELPNHPSLHIQRLDFDDLCNRIVKLHPTLAPVVEKSRANLRELTAASHPVGFSDVVRVFVLSGYGGVYLDCDVLLLQPLTALLGEDFYYQWSVRNFGNTAAFHLRKGSHNAYSILKTALERSGFAKSQRKLAAAVHPQTLHYSIRGVSTIQVLPTAYFDPLWIIMKNSASLERYGLKRWDDFFTVQNANPAVLRDAPNRFFSGSFAFHWHNQWQTELVKNSTADLFLQHYNGVLLS